MAELIVSEEQTNLPPSLMVVEPLNDSTSNLDHEHDEPAMSKSRTSSLGKMFQKMRLSEVRAKLKKEGSVSKDKMSEGFAKAASATDATDSAVHHGVLSSESVDGVLHNESKKSGVVDRASLHSSGATSNKGIRNYLGSWNACWQKPPNTDDIAETEYQSAEVLKEQIISAECDNVADNSLNEVPLRPMTPTNEDAKAQPDFGM